MSNRYSVNDKNTYKDSDVLINRLNIKDAQALEEAEFRYSTIRSVELTEKFLKVPFNTYILKDIHKKLFSDVYDWAGEYRTVDISKGNSRFCNMNFIESELERVYKEIKSLNYLQNLDQKEFSEQVAYFIGEINAIHPFREGNGRTQREFINQLALNSNYYVNWHDCLVEDILEATIKSFAQEYGMLSQLIFDNLILFD